MSLEELEEQQARQELELHRTHQRIEDAKNAKIDEQLASCVEAMKKSALEKQRVHVCLQQGLLPMITAIVPCKHKDIEGARQQQIQNVIQYYMSEEPLQPEWLEILRISLGKEQVIFRVTLGMTPGFRCGAVNIPYGKARNMDNLFPHSLSGGDHTLREGEFFTLVLRDQQRIINRCLPKYPEQMLAIDFGDHDQFNMQAIFELMEENRKLPKHIKNDPSLFLASTEYCVHMLKEFALDAVKAMEEKCSHLEHTRYISSAQLEALLYGSASPPPLQKQKVDVHDGCDYLSRNRPFYYCAPRKRKHDDDDY